MAKIRAYKLAEELGIDKNEFVEKAAGVGIELKSAMTGLSEEEANTLRSKLGGVRLRGEVEEKRVESGGRTTLIRRRKKPVPVPEPVVKAPAVEASEAVAVAGAEESEPEAGPEIPESEAVPEIEEPAAAEPAQPEQPAAAPAARQEAPAAPRPAPAGDSKGPADRKGRQRKRVREVVNLQEQERFARQITGRGAARRAPPVINPRSATNPRRKRRDALPPPVAKVVSPADQKKVARFEGEISVGELARQVGVKAAQLQGKLMALGTMVSLNQTIPAETVEVLAADLGFEVQDVGFNEEEFLELPQSDAGDTANQLPRPPVITVMGHVDHGKTSLLDAIRHTSVVDGEAGGITQHIGAYQTTAGDSTLTFIDTPGHAAFTSMRARGAQVTDIAVLVVAASEGVMPQTIEAINHAKAAGCPIVVAINKVDLPGADPQQTRQRLIEHELIAEEFGGDTICVDVSATKGTGLDQLLEMLSLQAEVLELKADPTRRAKAVVLEARLDKGRGPVATVLVQDGTLKRGDTVVVGSHWGRVRTLENDVGERVKEAGPSVPIQVDGLSSVPEAGAILNVVENERAAKQIVDHRLAQARNKAPQAVRPRMSLEDIFSLADDSAPKELAVCLKADVHGTCEAVVDSLEKLSTDAVKLKVLSSGVGGITENDVMLARASDAIVVGFNVRPDGAARRMAEDQGVEIRSYRIIYELIDDVRAAMAGLLPPTIKENVLGRAEVRQPFTIPKVGTIAGSYVIEGTMKRNAHVRLIRDGVQVYDGRMGSLRRFKDDVREVQRDFECGIGIENYNDLKPGDVIEAYELEETPATL